MKKTKRARKRPLRAMTAGELAEATATYGQEMAIDAFVPMSEASRSRWERARRKAGRPRRGRGRQGHLRKRRTGPLETIGQVWQESSG